MTITAHKQLHIATQNWLSTSHILIHVTIYRWRNLTPFPRWRSCHITAQLYTVSPLKKLSYYGATLHNFPAEEAVISWRNLTPFTRWRSCHITAQLYTISPLKKLPYHGATLHHFPAEKKLSYHTLHSTANLHLLSHGRCDMHHTSVALPINNCLLVIFFAGTSRFHRHTSLTPFSTHLKRKKR